MSAESARRVLSLDKTAVDERLPTLRPVSVDDSLRAVHDELDAAETLVMPDAHARLAALRAREVRRRAMTLLAVLLGVCVFTLAAAATNASSSKTGSCDAIVRAVAGLAMDAADALVRGAAVP